FLSSSVRCVDLGHVHSFPTRRSSDLARARQPASALHPRKGRHSVQVRRWALRHLQMQDRKRPREYRRDQGQGEEPLIRSRFRRGDRKSTRLNSSHVKTSYAVFCLKKK